MYVLVIYITIYQYPVFVSSIAIYEASNGKSVLSVKFGIGFDFS